MPDLRLPSRATQRHLQLIGYELYWSIAGAGLQGCEQLATNRCEVAPWLVYSQTRDRLIATLTPNKPRQKRHYTPNKRAYCG